VIRPEVYTTTAAKRTRLRDSHFNHPPTRCFDEVTKINARGTQIGAQITGQTKPKVVFLWDLEIQQNPLDDSAWRDLI
jgi:hypothetical protein